MKDIMMKVISFMIAATASNAIARSTFAIEIPPGVLCFRSFGGRQRGKVLDGDASDSFTLVGLRQISTKTLLGEIAVG